MSNHNDNIPNGTLEKHEIKDNDDKTKEPETIIKHIYTVSSWVGENLTHYFGIFDSKSSIEPLFSRLVTAIRSGLDTRQATSMNIRVYCTPLNHVYWFDNHMGHLCFNSQGKTDTEFLQFCRSEN